jgi:hypothetical protein
MMILFALLILPSSIKKRDKTKPSQSPTIVLNTGGGYVPNFIKQPAPEEKKANAKKKDDNKTIDGNKQRDDSKNILK